MELGLHACFILLRSAGYFNQIRGMGALVVTTVLTIGVDFPQDLKVATQEERPHAMQQHTPRVTA